MEDPRFKTNAVRTQNQHELADILEEVTKTKRTEQWMTLLEENGLPCSPINTVDRVVHDPNINYRKMIVEVDQPHVGPMRIAGSPFHLSETPGSVTAPAPLLGQHTEEVLSTVLGYSQDKIEILVREKAAYRTGDLS